MSDSATTAPADLFTPLAFDTLRLQHRIVMGAWPLPPALAPQGVPTQAMADYYARRATPGGLIVCAPTLAAPGDAAACRPGLHAAVQVHHWRRVTDEIHGRGGYAMAHLCHPGAPALPPLASLEAVLDDLRSAAENAGDAGFDGVELDAASLLEAQGERGLHWLADALGTLAGVWPAQRVGAWLSPRLDAAGIAQAVSATGIGYLHVRGGAPAELRRVFAGALFVAAPGPTRVMPAHADALSFGEAFDQTPDLVAHLRACAARPLP